jgi:hypothetical protein
MIYPFSRRERSQEDRRHLHDETQPIFEAPDEDLVIPSREQEARPRKGVRCADERFEILVCLGDRMGEEGNIRRIIGNPAQMLDNDRGARGNGVAQLAASVEAMPSAAEQVARLGIRLGGRWCGG